MSAAAWGVLAIGAWSSVQLARLLAPSAVWFFWSAALALAVLAAVGGAGTRALRRLPRASEFEKAALGAVLGLGAASLAVMALAWAGLFRPWAASALLVAAGLWGAPGALDGSRALFDELRLHGVWLAPSAALLTLVGLAAAAPPHQYDALVYHLALPQAYLRQGSLAPVPSIVFSHFTQGAEMLYLLALGLGSDLTAQFLTALATALTAALVWALGRRLAGQRVAALAVLLLSLHTSVLLLGSTAYVENWVGLWLVASVLCFVHWLQTPLELPGGRPWLLLAGLFSGFAFDAKYYAAICPVVLGVCALARLGRSRAWRPAAEFALCAAAPVVPWLIKNAWYVGDPVFPFLYKWFPIRGVDWGVDAPAYFKVLTEYGHPRGFFKELLLFPAQLLHDPVRFGGGMDVLGLFGWPLVLIGAPLAWPSMKSDRLWRFLGVYLAAHFALWFSTRVVLRFLVPAAGLFALAAAQGYSLVWRRSSGAGRAALAAGLLAMAASQLYAFGYVHAVYETASVVFGQETPGAYLRRRLAYYPCASAAGLGPNDKILIVGEQRSYYVSAPSVPTQVYQSNLYQDLAQKAADGTDLAKRLREQGFTHVLWVPGEAKRLESYGVTAGLEKPAWSELLKASKPAAQGPGCALLSLP